MMQGTATEAFGESKERTVSSSAGTLERGERERLQKICDELESQLSHLNAVKKRVDSLSKRLPEYADQPSDEEEASGAVFNRRETSTNTKNNVQRLSDLVQRSKRQQAEATYEEDEELEEERSSSDKEDMYLSRVAHCYHPRNLPTKGTHPITNEEDDFDIEEQLKRSTADLDDLRMALTYSKSLPSQHQQQFFEEFFEYFKKPTLSTKHNRVPLPSVPKRAPVQKTTRPKQSTQTAQERAEDAFSDLGAEIASITREIEPFVRDRSDALFLLHILQEAQYLKGKEELQNKVLEFLQQLRKQK